MTDRITVNEITSDQLDALQARAADAEAWRHKSVQRALANSRLTSTLTAITEMAHEEITQQTGWGDGYRAALADLREVLATFQPTEQTTSHADADKVVTIPVLSPEECAAIDAERQRADLAERRLRLAHQTRRTKEALLDDIRRALCDAEFIQDDDPYSHADLADVIRQLPTMEEITKAFGTISRHLAAMTERVAAASQQDFVLSDKQPAPVSGSFDVCYEESPAHTVSRDGKTWTMGDCYCSLPAGHDGEHRCEPCAERHGAPGWSQTGAPDDGPTVREAAAADRNWDVEKAGE